MSTIMIIEEDRVQSNLAIRAQEFGYRVVLCAPNAVVGREPTVDARYEVNLNDKARLLEIARKESIDGVVSNSAMQMEKVAFIAGKMGLVGNSEESMRILGTKFAFRQLQHQLGILAPQCAAPNSFWSFLREGLKMTFPILIKPDFFAGAVGVVQVSNRWRLPFAYRAYRRACHRSINGRACIEEYMPRTSADIVECELCVYGDRYFFGALYVSHKSRRYPLLGMSNSITCSLTASELGQMQGDVKRIFTELGITWGEYNLEGYVTSTGEFFIIEINPRQGGGMLPDVSSEAMGIDYDRLLLSSAVGDTTYLNSIAETGEVRRWVMLHRVYANRRGVYQGLQIPPDFPGKFIRFTEKDHGSKVRPPRAQTETVALIIIEFATAAEMRQYAARLEELIIPIIV